MKAVLLLLVLGLSGLLYVQWEIAPEQAPAPPRQRGATSAEGAEPKAAIADLSLGDPQAFDVISQRPLFVEGRRPPDDAPEETAAPEQVGGIEGLDFSAVLITPQQSVAWVKDAEKGELVRLVPGEKIRGWTVKAVNPERLLLADGEKTNELELRKFLDKAVPPPRPPARLIRPAAKQPVKRPPPRQRAQTQNRRPGRQP